MSLYGLGIDIIEINRFRGLKIKNHFLGTNYSPTELKYCFSFKDPGPHLAGTFAAKEAVFKALGQKNKLSSSIEIRKEKGGQPAVWIKNRRQKSILVSISHTAKIAMAIAIKI